MWGLVKKCNKEIQSGKKTNNKSLSINNISNTPNEPHPKLIGRLATTIIMEDGYRQDKLY